MSNRSGSPSAALAVGETLDGKYQLLSVLGEGGMGTVYAAWHVGLEQRVAVKLLRSEDPEYDGVARQRFQREARAAARIQSEYVCRVLDTGSLTDGTPYLVMEHLDGCDLASELAKRGRLPLPEAVRYLRQTCAAVAEAHRAGIVHRDLKPANLFLHETPSGERVVKILDFGVSKSSANHGQMSLTRTAALVGSPIYMSPEQLKSSRDVDGRTDIWALGAILVELLTGRPPFDEETIGQLVNAVLHKESPRLRERGCEVPEELEPVVASALHKDRELRYQSAEQLSHALAPFDQPGHLPLTPSLISSRAELRASLAPLSARAPEGALRHGEPRASTSGRPVLTVSATEDNGSLSHSGARGVVPRASSLPRPPRTARSYLLPVVLLCSALAVLGAFMLGRAERPRLGPPALPAAVKSPDAAQKTGLEPANEAAREPTPVTTLSVDAASALPPEAPHLVPAAMQPQREPEREALRPVERRRSRTVAQPEAPHETPSTVTRSDDPLPNFGGRR